ncbi:MAG: hypothetical protein IJC30_03465 [Alphaproteobacteria bacterium]|nr:hypothetical protein [Alphaproteobacteria bacterium]
MKGILFAFLMLLSLDAYAQVRVRKVPFLPYLGAGGLGGSSGTDVSGSSQNKGERTVRIAFRKGSAQLGPSAKAAIKRIANSTTGRTIFIKAYYSRSITADLSSARQNAVFEALKDLNVPGMIERPIPEFRNDSSSVLDLNQVIVTY